MVKDLTTGEFFRADHLLEEHLEKLSSKAGPDKIKEYQEVIRKVCVFNHAHLMHTHTLGIGGWLPCTPHAHTHTHWV